MPKTELETLSAQMLLLDQALAEYGPPTRRSGAETASIPMAPAQATKAYLASLKPETDAQKQAVASANGVLRLLVDELDRLFERRGRDPKEAGIGQAEFKDQEDREGDRQSPER